MHAIAVSVPGKDYRLQLAKAEQPQPRAGEVLVKVAAAGINRADILQAMGHYPPPPGASQTLGLEVSGEIVALGDGVKDWAIGDAVCALLPGGGYAEFAVAAQECLLPVPESVSVSQAAALPEAFFTAWTNLFDAARLQPGETVLIHGGSSGIGTAAIQICAARDHTVFATAGSAEKCQACVRLGATRAIDYRQEDFVEIVRTETKGRGVDVIFDMVGGDYINRNFAAAAMWGRIVNVAYQSGPAATVNFTPMLVKRLTLTATTLRSRSVAEKAVIRDALRREVWPLIEAGRIRPVVDATFPLADAQAAHAHMKAGGHVGKILLIP